ncbi:hypothetical protein [Bremerella cremea]|uniref:hypothetical protein n=1 Tax=Bremerella cremea TaxID=1031537 RepID=UPI0031E6D1D4
MYRTLMLMAVVCAGLTFVASADAGWGRGPHYRNVSYHPQHATAHDYYTARYVSPYHGGLRWLNFGN